MADNYLEKKMEDYRRGNLNRLPRQRSSMGSGNVPVLPVQSQRIALVVRNRVVREALLVAFQQIGGLKVAFLGSDYREGNVLAQKYGALFVGGSVSDSMDGLLAQASKRWGGIDVVVADDESCLNDVAEKQVLINFETNQTQIDNNSRNVNTTSNIIEVVVPFADFSADAIAKSIVMILTTPPKLVFTLKLSSSASQG